MGGRVGRILPCCARTGDGVEATTPTGHIALAHLAAGPQSGKRHSDRGVSTWRNAHAVVRLVNSQTSRLFDGRVPTVRGCSARSEPRQSLLAFELTEFGGSQMPNSALRLSSCSSVSPWPASRIIREAMVRRREDSLSESSEGDSLAATSCQHDWNSRCKCDKVSGSEI